MDDEITQLQARRTELEEQSELLHAILSNTSDEVPPERNTLEWDLEVTGNEHNGHGN